MGIPECIFCAVKYFFFQMVLFARTNRPIETNEVSYTLFRSLHCDSFILL